MVVTVPLMLSDRDYAILGAVAAGRCAVGQSDGGILTIDGMACCDQFAARRLLRSGVVSSEFEKEHAALTEFGRELISEKKSAGKESR
jgi:hypothetical protein